MVTNTIAVMRTGLDSPAKLQDQKEEAFDSFTNSTVSRSKYHENEPDPKAGVEIESGDAGYSDKAKDGDEVTKSLENKKEKAGAQLKERNNPPVFIQTKVGVEIWTKS